jgi:hypothetical protein
VEPRLSGPELRWAERPTAAGGDAAGAAAGAVPGSDQCQWPEPHAGWPVQPVRRVALQRLLHLGPTHPGPGRARVCVGGQRHGQRRLRG